MSLGPVCAFIGTYPSSAHFAYRFLTYTVAMKRTVIGAVFLLSCGRGILSIRFTRRQLLRGSWALWAFIVAVGLLPLAGATSQSRPATSDEIGRASCRER